MPTGIKHAAGQRIRRSVTWPPSLAPYFPSTVDVMAPDTDTVLYAHGEFARGWSSTASGYGAPSGVMTVDYPDGTWERFDVGPPHRIICGGTWEVLPNEE